MPDNKALPVLAERHVESMERIVRFLENKFEMAQATYDARDIELYVRAIQSGESVVVTRKPEPEIPYCPECGQPLQKVRYPGGYLNEDQWSAIRAGDWFCENHEGVRLCYFWNHQLLSRSTPDV